MPVRKVPLVLATIEKLTTGAIPSAVVRTEAGRTRQVRTIDLEDLAYVDLGGVRAILRLARSLKDGGSGLDFLGGSHAVRDALDQAGFHVFFPFTPPFHSSRGHHDETP